MAGITFYDAYFPTFSKALLSLESILSKAQAHAKENSIDADSEYIQAKLYEDMNPLPFQIHVVTNGIKKAITRLTGAGAEEWKDDETTIEQLLARVKKTYELLSSVKPEDINAMDGKEVEAQLGPITQKMAANDYITGFVLPNVFFHLQTTYCILRMKGVPLGKRDYIMPFLSPFLST